MRRALALFMASTLVLTLASGCANGRTSVKAGAITIGAGVGVGLLFYGLSDGSGRDGEANRGFGAVVLGGSVVFVGVILMLAGAVQAASENSGPSRADRRELANECLEQRDLEIASAETFQDPGERARSFRAVRSCTDDLRSCHDVRGRELRAGRAIADPDLRARALHASRRCGDYDARARGQEYGTLAECEAAKRETVRRALTLTDTRERGLQIVAAPVCEPADFAPRQ